MPKPVILSVDDDPEVLNAIERDLRSHYRSEYRIVKAGSGREALEAAQELKKRGTPIALLLADQRMPGMQGTEFLLEARKLYPDARRVLLTAYADTEAAIASINDVGLDHYLMKPWDPPEEKLYPALDDLLGEWQRNFVPAFEGIRVAGSRWSAQCHDVKEFLSRNHVPYQWIDIELDAATRELVTSLEGDAPRLPVVFFPDGSHTAGSTNHELAEKLGMHTHAAQPFYDVCIVGGGPAGLAAAVYGASEGLRTLLVEQDAPGGQAGTSSRIENYLGFPNGITGADLAQRAAAQALRFGAEVLNAQEVVSILRNDPYRIVRLADGTEVTCYAVVLATGMAVRRLDAPGVEALTGISVYYGAAMTEAATCRGSDVCVVGGANSAGQGALFFARNSRRVIMLVRAATLGASMSQYLVDRISATPNIVVRTGVDVAAVHGNAQLESVEIRQIETGAIESIHASAMFIFVGAEPRSTMLADLVDRDEGGFILTGPDLPRVDRRPRGWALARDPFLCETNVPGIFAVGDVRAGANRRVAAAVGEGSATIHMVHKYLETV